MAANSEQVSHKLYALCTVEQRLAFVRVSFNTVATVEDMLAQIAAVRHCLNCFAC